MPRTWLREGPLGIGMVQLWQDVDPAQDAVDLVAADAVPEQGWRHVFDGYDAQDRPVSLIHEDSPPLRRMAVFDVVTNNADRKGGHVLEMADGHRYGIDHGLTFHAEHKLRTVLWGWVGEPLDPDERRRRRAGARRPGRRARRRRSHALLTDVEIDALAARCDRLLDSGHFPRPRGEMPAIPWPPF